MRIVLADNQPERSETIRRVLLGEGLACDAGDVVPYADLPVRLAGVKPDLVLVTCNGAPDDAIAAIRMAHETTGVPILAVGQQATVEVIREAMRAGACEFLQLNAIRFELSQALAKIEAEGRLPSRRGTLIAVFSPNGGVGVSTTAVNLAARLAQEMPDQVALIDLNPAPSDLALLLDVDPLHTLGDLCAMSQRLDRKMLEGTMVRHASGVRVLAQAGYPADGGSPENLLSPAVVRQLCTLARRSFATTILDLAHTLHECQLEAMRLSNLVALIARPDVPGLRRARWALDAAAAKGVARDRFRLVLNCYGRSGQVHPAKVEEILGIQVFQQIPEDHRAVHLAANRGVPLVELSRLSRISRSFSSFARSVQSA